MTIIQIAAKHVIVGDRIHNPNAFHPSAAWIRVNAVSSFDATGSVKIETPIWYTIKHPEEGIAVQRDS